MPRLTNNSNKKSKNLSPKRNAGKSKTNKDEDRRRQSPSADSNKQTYWNEEWLSIEAYQSWLRADQHKTTLAVCITCNAKIKLGNMGIGAVKSHAKGERHLKILASSKPKGSRSVKEMLMSNTEPVPEARGENGENEVVDLDQAVAIEVRSVPSSTLSVSPFVISEKVVDAEIIWALKNVMDHHSKRSVDEDAKTFRRMFPDSQIAQQFKLGRTKLSYVLYFGLAEYFRQLLREDLRKCQYFVVAFDESFNTISQRGQMDLHIKFFDENGELVCTRYLTSVFLRAASSKDLLAHFKEGLAGLPLNKMLQVSMDGPNVNWKFIQLLEEDLWMKPGTPQNFPRFLNLGSCGLHVVHGAFNTGHDKAGWTLHTALSNAYWLFKDSSVRRAAFQALSGHDTFPKKFCRVRWVENVATASTFLSIYDDLKRFVQTEDKELKKKLTKLKSWQNLKKQFDDPFLKAKLLFFNSIAQDVEPFLRQFQSSFPLAPLLYEECHDMVRGMMRRFVKHDVMKSATSVPLLMAIKLSEDDLSNLKDVKNLNLGFATTQEINALEKTVGKKNSKITALNILEFKTECRKFCLHFTAKMIQRSPLRYEAVKAISCLSPIIIAQKPKRAEERMQLLLQILNENHWIPSTKAERVVNQFNDLLEQASSNPSMKDHYPINSF